MLNFIDNFLNRITMYRLVLYYLIFLLAIAAIFGAVGILPYSPVAVIFSSLLLVVAAWAANTLFSKIFKAHPNVESAYITALILALIITPGTPTQASVIAFLAWAAVWAMASKYILAIDKKHIFNPAAFAVVVTAFTINQSASWWIGGNLPMMAFVLIGGLLVIRKIQRFDLAIAFFVSALFSDVLTHAGSDPISTIEKAILHTPLFFFAAIMITEPLTTPPTRRWRVIYGAIVGLLFAPAIHIGSIYSTPELALLAGNIFSYAVSPKGKQVLALKEKNAIGDGIYEFVFDFEKKLRFRAGQYLEWTLAHASPDSRGNRRYFTIASSPTEKSLHLGVRFYDPSSSFKKTLLAMQPGDTIVAGQLAGEFTLPKDPGKKLAFIAGGIGITPFRSMIKYLSDRGKKRDVVLFYANRNVGDIAYRDVLEDAKNTLGMKTVYMISGEEKIPPEEHFYKGLLSAEIIKRELPDYKERMFYISGTHAMVSTFEEILRGMGVPHGQIKIDFFPGFV